MARTDLDAIIAHYAQLYQPLIQVEKRPRQSPMFRRRRSMPGPLRAVWMRSRFGPAVEFSFIATSSSGFVLAGGK